MPWSRQRKSETRERILDAAALAFREQGIEQTSVADVMKRAGLTHGGFYAHFKSKEDLVGEAIRHASDQVSRIFDASGEKESARPDLLKIAAAYLSVPHMANPERGCPVAALGPELIRGDQKLRKAISRETRVRLEKLYRGTNAKASPGTRKRQAVGALACMVGGLILARALTGQEGEEFLTDCREFLRDALTAGAPTDGSPIVREHHR